MFGFVSAQFNVWSVQLCAFIITVPIWTHAGVFLVSVHTAGEQSILFSSPSTQMRAAHHQRALKSRLHYSELRQTPAPLRLGEWDH